MTATQNPNEKQMTAPEYIRANFHPSDRIAVLVRKRGRGEIIQRITTADKVAATPFQDWLHYKNEKENCDVYVGMNALKADAFTRTKDDILAIRHLYVDLDHEGTKSLASIEQSDLVPKPSYVLNTSPDKFQVIWKMEEMPPPQAEAMLHAIAAQFDGYDAVQAAPNSHKIIFENEIVRLLEVTVPPTGSTIPMHHHRWPGFFLSWDTGGKSPHIRYHRADGSVSDQPGVEEPVHPGTWSVGWMKPEPMHAIEVVDNPGSATTLPQGPSDLRIEIKCHP